MVSTLNSQHRARKKTAAAEWSFIAAFVDLFRSAVAWIAASAKAESSRLTIWTPVVIGAGSGLYFSLKSEPSLWALAATAGACIILGALVRQKQFRLALACLAIGFVAADFRTAVVSAPTLQNEQRPKWVTGRIRSVEESEKSRRLVIDVFSIQGIAQPELPERIRINWRGQEFAAAPGDLVEIRAGLSPPPPPAAPGAFDFGRHLFFQRIGAVGYAVTPPRVLGSETATSDLVKNVAARVERTRVGLSRRIVEKAPGQGGAIVAAFVTGKRGAINDASEAALRDAGLAHLLAISGLHMGLATGLIFFAVRGALAVIEPLALRYPIKKWSAVAALASGFYYLVLSGGGWSARRAFIMASLFFLAILVDRRAFSLRNVAIAATVILLMTPEAVLHPGFQMSFAAVTALVAAYEWATARVSPFRSFTWFAKIRRYTVGIAVTDTVAALATAPYSLYHFNRAALYGLPANMLAAPLMAFWIMPIAIFALLLAPFDLDGWAWRLSADGVEWILASAHAVSSQKGAVRTVSQWPPVALILLTIGGLWLCIMREKWRLLGVLSIPLTAAIVALTPAPVLLVSRDGKNVGVAMGESGARELSLLHASKDRFTASVWKDYVGLNRDVALTKNLHDVGACDSFGCVVGINGAKIAVSLSAVGLGDDCRRGDLVIATYPVNDLARKNCETNFKTNLIDLRSIWNGGAHAVWISRGPKINIRTVNEARGDRPWSGESHRHRD